MLLCKNIHVWGKGHLCSYELTAASLLSPLVFSLDFREGDMQSYAAVGLSAAVSTLRVLQNQAWHTCYRSCNEPVATGKVVLVYTHGGGRRVGLFLWGCLVNLLQLLLGLRGLLHSARCRMTQVLGRNWGV